MRTAIITYSMTGHTRQVAEAVATRLGVRVTEILAPRVTQGNFTIFRWGMAAVLGWSTPVSLAGPGLEGCDAVILAAPIWAGQVAVPMRSWLARGPALPGTLGLILTGGAPTQSGRPFDQFTRLSRGTPKATLYVGEADLTPSTGPRLTAQIAAFCQDMSG